MKILVLLATSLFFLSCVSTKKDTKLNLNDNITQEKEQPITQNDDEESLALMVEEECVIDGCVKNPIIQMELFEVENMQNSTADATTQPKELIEQANQQALQEPVRSTIKNSLVLYNYYDKYIYSVYTAPQRVTVLRFDKNEIIDGELVVGDSANWIIESDSAINRPLVYIKPLLPHLATNMIINTNKRSYYLHLQSNESTFMVAVEWHYPMEAFKNTQKKKQIFEEPMLLKDLNFSYRFINYGKEPLWKPNKVFDNGEKTFIQFFNKYSAAKAPALFIINSLGQNTLTNYRVVGDYYIVDTLFDRAELRLGTNKEDSILIVNEGKR